MGYRLGATSKSRLQGVHPDLVRVIERAIEITGRDFAVIEGLRTPERQAQLVAEGKSMTERSRHLTGHAVDIVPYHNGRPDHVHWPAFWDLADYIKQAAHELNVPIEWGGDWQSFPDGAHWQLPRDLYTTDTYNAPMGIGMATSQPFHQIDFTPPAPPAEEDDTDRTGLAAGTAVVAGGGASVVALADAAQDSRPDTPASATEPVAATQSTPAESTAESSLLEQGLVFFSDPDRLILIFGAIGLVSGLFLLYKRIRRWRRVRPSRGRRS